MRTPSFPVSHHPAARWLVRFQARVDSSLRLFCFPHAGAGASFYRSWAAGLPEAEICAVQLPGREERFEETPFRQMDPLVESVVDALSSELDSPFAVFGHSFGAIVAFEFCRRLRRIGLPTPAVLFVSGHSAPHLSNGLPGIHDLPDANLLQAIQERYNGIPPAILAEPELLGLLIPTLRADVSVLETYTCGDGPTLDCPISALGGLSDPWSSEDLLSGWHAYTSGRVCTKIYSGGHFFVVSAREAVWDGIRADLRLTLRRRDSL